MFVSVYLNRNNDVKRFEAKSYYLPNGIIKNYKMIINGKNFYDKPINSDIKRYEEIKKIEQDKVRIILMDVY